MKRIIILCLFAACLFFKTNVACAADITEVPEFAAVVSGEILEKHSNILSDKRIWLLPLRETCKKLGISEENIKWNTRLEKVEVNDNDNTVCITSGEDIAYLNGEEHALERAAVIYKGKLYLSLDFYEDVLNCRAVWDKANGVLYIQRKEVFDKIYNLLKGAVVANITVDNELFYEYNSYAFTRDASNGYELSSQERSEFSQYDFKTGECVSKDLYTRLGREFRIENQYRRNILYVNEFDETKKIYDKNKIDEFVKTRLSNAFLLNENGKIKTLPVASSETTGFSELSELEKLSLVLKVRKGSSNTEIYGSTLGLITPLNMTGIIDEQISYEINNITGKLVKISSKSVAVEKVYGINVEVITGWNCCYKTK